MFSTQYELNVSVYDIIYTYMSWGRAATRGNDQGGFESENWNFIMPVPCEFLQLIQRLTNVLNKLQFITNIKILHVSAPGCHPQGVKKVNQSRYRPGVAQRVPGS